MPHSNAKPSTSKNVSNSRTRRNTREREKRKSQSSAEKNDNSTTEKTSPSKGSYKCTGLCKDLIQTWSTPTQFGYLKDVLCSGVAEDLSYRLRFVIHDSLTKARLCGRNSILASDIDDCLQVLHVDKIYGPAKAPQFAKDELVVNLFHLAEYNVSYPQPADVQLTRSWLPMTTTTITPADSDPPSTGQTVVSAALSHYHRVICRALVTPSSPRHRHIALHDLRTSDHIGPIIDWLYSFAYRVLRKDVSYGGPTTTQAALDLIEALEANVQAVSQVSNKVIELLVRLLLQRILRTCADNSLLRPMCAALALLCTERNCMRELVIGKLMTRATGCAAGNANGPDDSVISIVIAAQVLGIDAVERVILPEATLMGLLCRVAKRADNELTTALKLIYYTICKEYMGDNRLEIDNLFLDTFNYALLPMWVQPPHKQEGIVRDYNPDWVYSQLVKSRRILNDKALKIKKEDFSKSSLTLQQIFPYYHVCCTCRNAKSANFWQDTPKKALEFHFNKNATKCAKCVFVKTRENGLKPKLIIGKRKLLISVFKDQKMQEKSLNTCYINTFRFHIL